MDYFTLLTTAGKARIAGASSGNRLIFTSIAVGSNDTLPVETITALGQERYRALVNNRGQDVQQPNRFFADAIIPSNVGGWYIRETGLYGKLENEANEVLLAVGRCPETWKPLLTSGAGKDIVIKFMFQIENPDLTKINIVVDSSLILASVFWVEENFLKKIDALGSEAQQNAMILKSAEEIGLIKTYIGGQ